MTDQTPADEDLPQQIRSIAELPLEERGEAIRQAEVHLRSLLEGDA
jgi:hypothetical protein